MGPPGIRGLGLDPRGRKGGPHDVGWMNDQALDRAGTSNLTRTRRRVNQLLLAADPSPTGAWHAQPPPQARAAGSDVSATAVAADPEGASPP